MQRAMEIDRASPEARKFLVGLMDYLEKVCCLVIFIFIHKYPIIIFFLCLCFVTVTSIILFSCSRIKFTFSKIQSNLRRSSRLWQMKRRCTTRQLVRLTWKTMPWRCSSLLIMKIGQPDLISKFFFLLLLYSWWQLKDKIVGFYMLLLYNFYILY